MPLNPKVKAMLEEMVASKAPSLTSLPPPESRRMARTMFAQMAPSEPVANVVDRAIPGPGGSIPVRIYRPALAQPLPILVFFHGGGFVIGDLDTHDAVCRALTNRAQCVTLSVDYRLAPEHPAPAAGDDCYAATTWAHDNAKSLGVDPERLAVGGDSAGGNLAAVVALMARDRSAPPIGFQLLIYPATNAAFDTYSHRTFTDYFLRHEDCVYFWNQYSPTETERADPYVSPARAKSHRGLPPALIITAEFDPLRDEGEAYAEILRAAGGSAKATRYDGMIHGFYSMAGILDEATAAIEESAAALRAAWRS